MKNRLLLRRGQMFYGYHRGQSSSPVCCIKNQIYEFLFDFNSHRSEFILLGLLLLLLLLLLLHFFNFFKDLFFLPLKFLKQVGPFDLNP